MSQRRLKDALRLAANVITISVSVLEEHGYVTRQSGKDAPDALHQHHPAGISHIDDVNKAVVRTLYEDFPTRNDTFRTILEAAIAAGTQIDPPSIHRRPSATPRARALVAIEFIQQETERALKATCRASLRRVPRHQLLGEKKAPVRVGAIAGETQGCRP